MFSLRARSTLFWNLHDFHVPVFLTPVLFVIYARFPRLSHSTCLYWHERPPKPPTFWNSYTRTLILDTIMKLSGTIGVTQKTMTLDTHVRLILLQTLHPQERWGTHKKRWPFQPRLFADVIGLVRCSHEFAPLLYVRYTYVYSARHKYIDMWLGTSLFAQHFC